MFRDVPRLGHLGSDRPGSPGQGWDSPARSWVAQQLKTQAGPVGEGLGKLRSQLSKLRVPTQHRCHSWLCNRCVERLLREVTLLEK